MEPQPVLLIWDVYPGSEFFHLGSRVKNIPDPRSGFFPHPASWIGNTDHSTDFITF
jgi:hypothetical protein